ICRSPAPARTATEEDMKSPTALRIAVPAVLAVIVIEAAWSIAARWPHQFGGQGNRHQVLSEFVSSGGTALAPPLVLVILLGLIAIGVQRNDRWRSAATVLLIPVAVVMAIGAAGEALAKATPNVPHSAPIAGGTVGALLSLMLLALAIGSLTNGSPRRLSTTSVGKPAAASRS
ncbi:MAG: hypothetical protein ACRD6W_17850, partial [Nitrososphaerales archaeon]